jgi:hypothetical protein
MIELNGTVHVFLGGMLGPLLVELARVANWRNKKRVTARYNRPAYWFATGSFFLIGGIVTVVQGIDHVPIVRAIQLGATAPLLVSGWASGKNAEFRSVSSALGGQLSLRDLLSW